MKKLSEQFLEMSKRTAALENRAEALRQENRKEFDAHVAETKSRVQAIQSEFAARLDNTEESLAAQWRDLEDSFNHQVAILRQREEKRLNALDRVKARIQADDAEEYAEIAAEFAHMAAAEAEAAAAEATAARARAASLEETAQ